VPVTGPSFFLDRDGLHAWDLGEPLPASSVLFSSLHETFRAIADQAAGLSARFVATASLTGSLGITGDDVVVCCITDEWAQMPSYDTDVRVVFKTCGTRRRITEHLRVYDSPWVLPLDVASELLEQRKRVKAFARYLARRAVGHHGPPVFDLPLGFLCPPPAVVPPMADRPTDLSFMGSLVNVVGASGLGLVRPKERSRRQLLAVLEDMAAHGYEVEVTLRKSFHHGQHHHEAYSAQLARSKFVPCPRGLSLETYRYYEALAHGCVPIVERLPRRYYYGGGPAIGVNRWDEIPSRIAPLLADDDALAQLQESVLSWWQTRCSPAATAQRILSVLASI
jgi:hypothetical protein